MQPMMKKKKMFLANAAETLFDGQLLNFHDPAGQRHYDGLRVLRAVKTGMQRAAICFFYLDLGVLHHQQHAVHSIQSSINRWVHLV